MTGECRLARKVNGERDPADVQRSNRGRLESRARAEAASDGVPVGWAADTEFFSAR